MDVIIISISILFALQITYCIDNDNVKVKLSELQANDSGKPQVQDAWQAYEKNIPLGLMLSKREAHKNTGKHITNIKKEMPGNRKEIRKDVRSKSNVKVASRSKPYKNAYFTYKNARVISPPKKSNCLSCCCCKRRLSKKKMKEVMGLLKEAMKTFDDPPPKPKPLAPPCDLGTCCMPCTQASCGCCCPCTQMVKVKYHPPQFDFEAMKGSLMCGCGFGNPCGGCLMKTGGK